MTLEHIKLRSKCIKELKKLGFLVDRRPGHSGYLYKTQGHFHLIAWIDKYNILAGLLRICNDIDCDDEISFYYCDDLKFDEDNFDQFIPKAKKAIKMLDKLNKTVVGIKKDMESFKKLKDKNDT